MLRGPLRPGGKFRADKVRVYHMNLGLSVGKTIDSSYSLIVNQGPVVECLNVGLDFEGNIVEFHIAKLVRGLQTLDMPRRTVNNIVGRRHHRLIA